MWSWNGKTKRSLAFSFYILEFIDFEHQVILISLLCLKYPSTIWLFDDLITHQIWILLWFYSSNTCCFVVIWNMVSTVILSSCFSCMSTYAVGVNFLFFTISYTAVGEMIKSKGPSNALFDCVCWVMCLLYFSLVRYSIR